MTEPGPGELVNRLEQTAAKQGPTHSRDAWHALGDRGEDVIPTLLKRLSKLSRKLPKKDPKRMLERARVVVTLRLALGVALKKHLKAGATFDPKWEPHFLPRPHALFSGSTIGRSFLQGLRGTRPVFSAMPDERCEGFVAQWRGVGIKDVDALLAKVVPPRSMVPVTTATQVRRLAEKSKLPLEEVVYLLSRETTGTSSRSLNRVGRLTWEGPTRLEPELQPVLLLDLQSVPEVGARFPSARALCVLVDRPQEGFERDAVLPLDAEAAAAVSGGVHFAADGIGVPSAMFDDEPPGGPVKKLLRLLEDEDRAHGRPRFLQQNAHSSDGAGFVLQAGATFCDPLNLGDAGRLFVYDDHAFWESA